MVIIPVILGGGVGSRLWPLSRSTFPKQYNAFLSDKTLFQSTLHRSQFFSDQVLIVAGEAHRFLVLEQSAALNIQPRILLEPVRRDTAPAIALAAHYLQQEHHDPLMLVMPADHQIQNTQAFYNAVERAAQFAERGYLVAFGCQPEYPSSAYGYIQRGEAVEAGIYWVRAFIEKPTIERARTLLARGHYDWNSGIFLFRASHFIEELSCFENDINDCVQTALETATTDGLFLRPGHVFANNKAISIDYAVMEKTDKAMTVSVDMGWSDVGSWQSLHNHLPKDKKGNTFVGDVLAQNVEDSYIRSTHRLVTGLGLKNLIVVETRDAVLVADKSDSEAVKDCVKQLENTARSEIDTHARVYRPWGFYETLEKGLRFQVKRICVKPNACLSLQRHDHRSEHWVVLSGEGEVICGDNSFLLTRDQSTYIPNKTKHRLKNVGDQNLELIEIQVGDYISEEDIYRYEDQYGRVELTT